MNPKLIYIYLLELNIVLIFTYNALVSSTAKTDRHVIAEILLKVALKHKKNKIKSSISWV